MTGVQAARVAADLRERLGDDVQVENGHYGECKVFVDGQPVVTGGPLGFLGVLPSVSGVRAAVAAHEQPSSGQAAADAGAGGAGSARGEDPGGREDTAERG